ncbi:hypothetical protein [Streptomyces sp. SA15]|uniref:hypothetical protein n=1 Tax=Streptomyces sp. SA15 TaxID=934019 RepID=UPI00359C3B5A
MSLAQKPLSVEVTVPREDVALIRVAGYLDVDSTTEFQLRPSHGKCFLFFPPSPVRFGHRPGMVVIDSVRLPAVPSWRNG